MILSSILKIHVQNCKTVTQQLSGSAAIHCHRNTDMYISAFSCQLRTVCVRQKGLMPHQPLLFYSCPVNYTMKLRKKYNKSNQECKPRRNKVTGETRFLSSDQECKPRRNKVTGETPFLSSNQECKPRRNKVTGETPFLSSNQELSPEGIKLQVRNPSCHPTKS